MIGIYGIKNKINGKIYIGQSINILRRWRDHRKRSKIQNYEGSHLPLYRAFEKYGLNNFNFIIIEECLKEDLNNKEIYWIEFYDSTNREKGYNISPGGNSPRGIIKLTEKEAKEIQELLFSSSLSQEEIAKQYKISQQMISYINRGSCWYNENFTYPLRNKKQLKKIKTREKYKKIKKSNKIKFKIKTKNYCIDCKKEISKNATRCFDCYNIFQRRAERPAPLELAQLVVEKGFVQTGRQFGVSDNAIKKWCKAYGLPHLKKELVEWYNKQVGIEFPKPKQQVRKVQQIDPKTGEILNIFDNATIAAKKFGGVKGSHVSEVCNGKSQTAYGYKWKYIEN